MIDRGLIIKTRSGGLSIGPDWFALTWMPISNFNNLDIRRCDYHPGKWRFMDKSPIIQKRKIHTASRNSTVPPEGITESSIVPPHGTKRTIYGYPSVPPCGNNENYQLPKSISGSRVVGKKERSGIKNNGITQLPA